MVVFGINYESIISRINAFTSRIMEIGGEVQEVIIGEPATPEQIAETEQQLGVNLPESFKRVLMEFSANFSIRWFFPENIEIPEEFREIFCGIFNWNLKLLPQIDNYRLDSVRVVFPDPENEYDKVWHNKLAFCDVENGDYLAFDMNTSGNDAPIVYLSHDDGEGHGYIMANNFIELLDHWSRLGFVGSEDWQWFPFTTSPDSGIIPDGDAAIRFRKWLGVNI